MCYRFSKHPSTHTHDYICCSYKELWEHLQKHFKDGMTKENQGKVWHIDHIIPLSFFDLNDLTEAKIANHWGNLQPLFKEENLSKHDKIPDKQNFLYI
jgi:5-methylcytosine-specific restriction endonuclease McrA